ncbi:protein of unknown function [Ruminococcaceae bacterium BL-4]|jgi:two-component system response regulator (stage 0 sporulation protein A)|nr:protein of unknown function [Ruminococcaceae bacterium BL-4]
MRVPEVLKEFGVPMNVRGYQYLKAAIQSELNKEEILGINLNQYTYPAIAEKYHVTSTSVERCCRHAISLGFKTAAPETIKRYFGNSIHSRTGIPTVSEFISALANYMKESEEKS